jgi:hypothetical protein
MKDHGLPARKCLLKPITMTIHPLYRNCLIARLLGAMMFATAGSAMAAAVINVNYGGNPSAFMQGIWSHDMIIIR